MPCTNLGDLEERIRLLGRDLAAMHDRALIAEAKVANLEPVVEAALAFAKGTAADQLLPWRERPVLWDCDGERADALSAVLDKVKR